MHSVHEFSEEDPKVDIKLPSDGEEAAIFAAENHGRNNTYGLKNRACTLGWKDDKAVKNEEYEDIDEECDEDNDNDDSDDSDDSDDIDEDEKRKGKKDIIVLA